MSMLRQLSTVRVVESQEPPVRYDPERKISVVWEDNRWVPSFESAALPGTKKADLEKGEDQKGL